MNELYNYIWLITLCISGIILTIYGIKNILDSGKC